MSDGFLLTLKATPPNVTCGEGQRRDPPCCVNYVAAVLARTVIEVQERWTPINSDTLNCTGFGLGQQPCQTEQK